MGKTSLRRPVYVGVRSVNVTECTPLGLSRYIHPTLQYLWRLYGPELSPGRECSTLRDGLAISHGASALADRWTAWVVVISSFTSVFSTGTRSRDKGRSSAWSRGLGCVDALQSHFNENGGRFMSNLC